MKAKIIILGNGFDVSLGLKTKYSDFLKRIKETKSDEFIENNVWLNFYINEYNLLENDNYLWSDFENDLAKILNDSDGKSYESKLFWNMFYFENVPSVKIESRIKNDWRELNKLFLEYISTQNKIEEVEVQQNLLSSGFLYILNFNFTNNLVLKTKGINSVSTINLHGDSRNGILGSDKINNKSFDFNSLKKEIKLVSKGIDSLDTFILEMKNNYNNNFVERTDIYILGHSVAITDSYVYEKLIQQIPGLKWTIFYHNEESLDEIISKLYEINRDYFKKVMFEKKEFKNWKNVFSRILF